VQLRHRRGRMTAVASLGLLPLALLSACSGGSQAATAAEAVVAPVYTTDADAPPNSAVLNVANTTLGKVVVDNQGFTLYMFSHDSASPPKATCDGECALTWEPGRRGHPVRRHQADDAGRPAAVPVRARPEAR
jgi:predicted lipoprotein with Yx(FWY)xxD motif